MTTPQQAIERIRAFVADHDKAPEGAVAVCHAPAMRDDLRSLLTQYEEAVEALRATHSYIDCSDQQLVEMGKSRDDLLFHARTLSDPILTNQGEKA